MTKDTANALTFVENRRSPRHKADRAIIIEFQNCKIGGICVDYNEDGFGAVMEGELPVGEIMSVVLPVAGREPTRLQVRLLYRRDSRYGFQFIAPEHGKRQTIADFFREIFEGDF
jgi:hypothetical protein